MIAAAGSGVDQASLLASVGLDPDKENDAKKVLVDTVYYELLERIAELIDVTDLSVRTGASMRLDEYGALGLAWKAAPTLLGSYSRVERFARLWTSVVEYELRPIDRGSGVWVLGYLTRRRSQARFPSADRCRRLPSRRSRSI